MEGLKVIKSPPQGAGGGQRAKRAGGGGGDWDLGGAVLHGIQAPTGSGGGQRAVGRTDPSAQARGARTDGASGGRGGEGVVGVHMSQNESGRNAPPILRGTSKKGAAVRTLSAAERLSSYDIIATYPSDLWGRSVGVGAPARSSP